MVSALATKRVLSALADALPEDGQNVITKVEISRGWGNTIQVKIAAGAKPMEEPTQLRSLFQSAVDQALGDARHLVSIEWDYRA